jgi:hypothetical protein
MPSDLAISAIGASPPERDVSETPRPAATAASVPIDSSPGSPSPTLALNAALGIVVIEFLGKSGAITSSIPTQQQLEAYRTGATPLPGDHAQQTSKLTPVDT